MRTVPKMVAVCLCTALVAATLFVTMNTSFHQARAASKPDIKPALPTKAELPGFQRYQVTAGGKGSKRTSAQRSADGLAFEIVVGVAPTEAEAKKACERMTITQAGPGPMPKGSPTGRKIGQEVWNSYRGGANPTDNIGIIARDGRSIAYVTLALPVPRHPNGKFILKNGAPIRGKLSQADLTFAENHLIKALDKLTKMGYTSRLR